MLIWAIRSSQVNFPSFATYFCILIKPHSLLEIARFSAEMARISSYLCKGAAIVLALAVSVNAQNATQAWGPAATCTAGLSPYNPPDANGTFIDSYSATWQVNCGQRDQKVYGTNGGTNGRGISACFRGCDKRPGCTAFYYTGTVTGAATIDLRA